MKKFVTLMLALIMVFAMAVPAFADDFVPSPGTGSGEESDHDHDWSDWEEIEGGRMRTCVICGLTIIEYTDGEGEENPATGSGALFGGFALVSAAALAASKRRK